MTLTEFLAARLDEDERVAHEAAESDAMTSKPSTPPTRKWTHIARHDPARVLAEVEAKRRIVEMGASYVPELEHGDNGEWALDATLRLLALPYADHPDYRQEWRP
jgi:hypothetical protein